MPDISVCNVCNKYDESNPENLVVCSLWEDEKLKVYIVKDNNKMLFGEESNEKLQQYAKTFNKTLEDYLEDTKRILCGMENDVEFFLSDSKFYWKRKKWALGQIIVKPAQDLDSLMSFMVTLINEYSKHKYTLDEVQRNYLSIKSVNSEMENKLNEFQSLKEQLEDGLYKKFALVLNSKKNKIKDLADQLHKLKNSKSVFNDSTDESGSDSELTNNKSSHKNQKRAREQDNNKNSRIKRNKANSVQNNRKNCNNKDAIVNISNEIEPIPSTSNNIESLDQDEETPDLLSGESECDLELKFDEDKLEDNKVKESAITEEDSEEMF